MLKYGNVVKINKNLTYWRQHNTSVTSKNQLNGTLAMEDRNVLDYILEHYNLNRWQIKMAFGAHCRFHIGYKYETEEIKKYVHRLWNIKSSLYTPSKYLAWFIGALERHFNILL